jgi:hypothetical protein
MKIQTPTNSIQTAGAITAAGPREGSMGEARQRTERLVAAMRGGDKILHGAIQATIFAWANDIDAETERVEAEARVWERDSEL